MTAFIVGMVWGVVSTMLVLGLCESAKVADLETENRVLRLQRDDLARALTEFKQVQS